jgi:hypothetical protein
VGWVFVPPAKGQGVGVGTAEELLGAPQEVGAGRPRGHMPQQRRGARPLHCIYLLLSLVFLFFLLLHIMIFII